ncbi:MAG: COX15/CtaA family protein, partial [Myxococcales bacterium]
MLVHAFAIATAIATYLLILIGGLVHGTGSSLACPDWPTCYGTMIPKMEGGVAVEHSHRLAAGTVVILTLLLAALITRSRVAAHRPLRRVAWLAVGLVFAQALLGGITVLLRLPTPISTLHTATSLLFFCTVLYLAVRSRPVAPAALAHLAAAAPAHPSSVAAAGAPVLTPVNVALVTAVAVYFQMVLGGLVRHSGAALACLDIPLCRGSLWPDAHPTVLVQALHRLGAGTVALLVLASAVFNLRAAKQLKRPFMFVLAVSGPVLVAVQIWLGLHAVTSFLDLATVEAHLGVATALLATQMGLALGNAPARTHSATTAADGTSGAVVVVPWSSALRDLVELSKPRITGLVMATFAGGMWLAPGHLPRWRGLMTLLGTALIVAAANALNMFIERDVDKLMQRTSRRPLPQGRLSPEAALVFGTALAAIALPLLLLAGNALTGVLGGLAFISYVAIYTPMKRTSAAALFVGAVPGALPPLMGWTAVTGHIDAGA